MTSRPPSEPLLLNRELSLLKFNERVLAMAENPRVPLLERLRYVCIVSSNLDEFFEIRISTLKEQQRQTPTLVGPDGMTADEAFERVQVKVHALVASQYALLNDDILPRLQAEGIVLHHASEWNAQQQEWAREVFNRDVMPLLTPIGLDPAHPFPRVYNKSLNFIVALSGADAFGRQASIAVVQAPRALPRLIKMPPEISGHPDGYILLTSLLRAFVGELFPGLEMLGCYQWRVTRNSDLFVDEEEVTNLRHALQGELSQRNFGAAVRLEVDKLTPPDLEAYLQREFSLAPEDTYRVSGPVNLSRLMQLCNSNTRPDLLFPAYLAPVPAPFDRVGEKPAELFAAVAEQDRLLHHPYQSFQPVIDFLTAAALDPDVMAIKQTIYRTGEDSELMQILLAAACAGKEVTVVVELMARFDEQTNINWAARLEEVGAHVVYGVVAHKTHAKMALVLRREKGRLRRYAHLGTGNYHPRTARLYTDFGLLTADPRLCEDMDKVFTQLTGLGARRSLKALLQSPFSLHDGMVSLIRAETRAARAGKRARIMAKMNSLLEVQVIEELYKASQAGVKIDLIVRGVCALRAGVPGLSENIRVRSIVGRFLEHSRVFYFYADGAETVYLSSADWMDRNFFRRVEIAFPVYDKTLRKRVIDEAFTYALRDNQLAWQQQADGTYARVRNRREAYDVQEALIQRLGQDG
ncbi:polyphosphate kinase [Bordetella pertussis]|uniref:Polyphosphate kinase n=6 Tax=Bordetella pertussis TaxID=520 RepID=Q7VZ62_BORPE|nr:polyphosphate kinase 1 [Bordetella pertussis]ETH39115.1 polyphosphate kinase 1 [Bordetella pertussis H918]ETH42085.1 polyphosphate kinase 1 [Bordetella pertussis H939]ETH48004.1 polyphosphate kinase 1 [Bordetella pertussis H921]ETH71744.1 polyphosphate kinase 1 [Bordetella pertussis STO1-CHLA-0011]ETH82488.1 polyphosphate kinase 1 [Bordetella pertussis STO1-CHOC-0017]ETH88821.1 polyphosphate kinase 1 [Bordetella pertussis STO1-CHOC-0018]ETH92255.1 polyphosphate kinase 1 [Bordetella pertus